MASVGPGQLVGEYVALVGGDRTATVLAAEPTTVQLSGEALECLLRGNPEAAERVRREAAEKTKQTRVREALAGLAASRVA